MTDGHQVMAKWAIKIPNQYKFTNIPDKLSYLKSNLTLESHIHHSKELSEWVIVQHQNELAHRNKSIDIKLKSDTLSWFQASQVFALTPYQRSSKYQFHSLCFNPIWVWTHNLPDIYKLDLIVSVYRVRQNQWLVSYLIN